MGDLALYLVTRGLKASDVTDPAKKGQVDFPDSVVGLLEGRLGFPHKGFPDEVCDSQAASIPGTLFKREGGGHAQNTPPPPPIHLRTLYPTSSI